MGRERYWSRRIAKEEREQPGCMNGMLHFLDLHHLLFTGGCRTSAGTSSPPPEHHHHDSFICKGVEAPRNSLELEALAATAVTAVREEYYGVPIGIQISLPSVAKKKMKPYAKEEKRSSQAVTPRTSSIVARLMGLEVLQDDAFSSPGAVGQESISEEAQRKINTSKKKNTMKKKKEFMDEYRKAPAPAPNRRPLQNRNFNVSGSISLPETPRISYETPRFSLQLNKENNVGKIIPEFSYHGNVYRNLSLPVSPSSRRKKDSTLKDESKSFRSSYSYREVVKQMKENLPKREGNFAFNSDNKKLVWYDQSSMKKKKYSKTPLATTLTSVNVIKSRAKIQVKKVLKIEPGKCTKESYERFTERIKRQPSPTNLDGGQQASPASSQEQEQGLYNRDLRKTWQNDTVFQYVKAIVDRSCVVGTKAMKWFSPSLPIDPSIFHILELKFPSFHGDLRHLSHRWNRKLLFHLVEEILGDLLLSEPNRWRCNINGEQLLSRLWSEITSFPSADCRVVSDIDALVAGDLPEGKVRRLLRHPSVAAEAKEMTAEIVWDILDSLIGEAAASLALSSSTAGPRVGE